jgi:hypothetical protein
MEMAAWWKARPKTVRWNRLAVLLACLCLLLVTGSAAGVLGGLQGGAAENRGAKASPAPGSKGGSNGEPAAVERPEIAPRAARIAAPAPCRVTDNDRGFLGKPEKSILDRLSGGAIARVKRSSIGRSVAFKITLRDGTRGYYKPEQTFSSANWYAEVVAYYLDRALGLGRVPPVVSRRLPWNRLSRCSDRSRFDEVKVAEDGTVRGAFIWWLPRRLRELATAPGWESWIRVEPWQAWRITPFQRPSLYADELQAWRENRGDPPKLFYQQLPEPERTERPAELSDLIVFDYLTLNIDRWGNDNANVLTYGNKGPLIFLDNGAGFSPGPPKRGLMEDRLRVLQRFRRSTVEALRALDMERFADTLQRDKMAPLLTDSDLKALEIRRQAVLDRVDELQRTLGDEVLAW